MACKTSYDLHHNFPKLAEESGFTFSTHKPRVHIEWNKIRLIDIESLMRDRKFVQIEQHINDILDCVLESEFDVRILDEGVLKIFRLAQLAVEYQQFCRHYLDRSVYVLREEITGLAQELEYAKKTIREKEDEMRKLKRKTKYNIRAPLPYGNDNIANILLQTLANKNDIFPSSTQIDNVHYNKCSYCDKVFMNQLYLKSHISRRHSNVIEIPQKDLPRNENTQIDNEQSKLQNEIIELKTKLKEMEVLIKGTNDQNNRELNTAKNENTKEIGNCSNDHTLKTNYIINKSPEKQKKDVEISTNSEIHILEKIEEWKKEEFEKYNKEISLLRTEISSIIDCNKDVAKGNSVPNDNRIMEQLQDTIKQQSAEIASLKEELSNSRLKSKNDEVERKKEIDAQLALWAERTETQSKEYKFLLQKLDIVAKEAKESRELAEIEKQRAVKLQHLLEQNNNNVKKIVEAPVINKENDIKTENRQHRNDINENVLKDAANVKSPSKSTPMPDRKTLEKLHRKAQELLNQSISSSDVSSTSDSNSHVPVEDRNVRKAVTTKKKRNEDSFEHDKQHIHNKDKTNMKKVQQKSFESNRKVQSPEIKKIKSQIKKDNGPVNKRGSPIKVVRAKLTEEVNQRLVSLGVDPLRIRLPRDIFNRQRQQLQENNEIKSKKNPTREKINHYIMSYLDKKATITNKKTFQEDEYFSPNKSSKPFSLTSVISNVKSKAVSLLKTNDGLKKEEKTPYDNVTRKALFLLKTPQSPKNHKQNLENETLNIKESNEIIKENAKTNQLKNCYGDKHYKVSGSSEESDSNVTDASNDKLNQTTIKSPNRRPATISAVYDYNTQEKGGETKITDAFEQTDTNKQKRYLKIHSSDNSSDDNIASITEHGLRNAISDDNVNDQKQSKGVLKSASSMSSLYKKKVIFDMDAIQMKSVSASPSQSITERSDKNEKTELGIINLDTEEWDLSSIENEPQKEERTIKLSTRTSPKIAELKQSIESQLTRRNPTLSTALVGGVDVLQGPMMTKTSLGGSNTSLGSSILDDSEYVVHQNHTAVVKPKKITDKDDSEIDISEVVDDIIDNKHKSFK